MRYRYEYRFFGHDPRALVAAAAETRLRCPATGRTFAEIARSRERPKGPGMNPRLP
jgi:hypothetical protein